LIYSASVLGDTRIHSGFLLLRKKNKLHPESEEKQEKKRQLFGQEDAGKHSYVWGKMQQQA